MKKQLNLLAILLLLVTLPMYSNDDTDSNNTIDRSTGIASIITQSSGVVNVGNSCFGRPGGAFEAKVMDGNGNPAIGASILIARTKKGAYVKPNGIGLVPHLSQGTYTIKISYAGYSSILDTISIEAGDTLRKSYKLDGFVTSGCYFYYDRIVDVYEIGSVTTFSSSEIQGRGWGASNTLTRSKKLKRAETKEQQDSIESRKNFADLLTLKNSCRISIVAVNTNEVEINPIDYKDISDYIKVYPNPTEGPLTIELDEDFDHLLIAEMNGNIILEISPNKGVIQVDLSEFTSGVYFLKYNYKGNWGSSQIQLSR